MAAAAPRPLIVRLAASFAATTGLAIASVVWSEFWFWSRWRPDNTMLELGLTVVSYGLVVQVCRFAAQRFRVLVDGPGAWRRVFLIGALYGWLVEGVVVTTVVMALPWTIPNTGLSWHALFTVLLGWWWIPRLLTRPLRRAILPLALLGLGVGAWGVFWRFEEQVPVDIPAFALFTALSTLAYAVGLAMWMWFRRFAKPGLFGTLPAMLYLGTLVVFDAVGAPITLIGPALILFTVLGIWFTDRRARTAEAMPATPARVLGTDGPAPIVALWRLAVVPVAAVLAYSAFGAWPEPVPTGWLYFAVTVPLGSVLFFVGLVRVRATAPESSPSAPPPRGR